MSAVKSTGGGQFILSFEAKQNVFMLGSIAAEFLAGARAPSLADSHHFELNPAHLTILMNQHNTKRIDCSMSQLPDKGMNGNRLTSMAFKLSLWPTPS